MNRIRALLMLVMLLSIATIAGPAAAEDGRSERLRFAKGASTTVTKGQIKGYQYVDYLLRGSAGQTLSVAMKTGNGANYFNVIAPGGGDVAMFIGSMSGERFSGLLPADGTD